MFNKAIPTFEKVISSFTKVVEDLEEVIEHHKAKSEEHTQAMADLQVKKQESDAQVVKAESVKDKLEELIGIK